MGAQRQITALAFALAAAVHAVGYRFDARSYRDADTGRVDAALSELREALLSKNGAKVISITDALRAPYAQPTLADLLPSGIVSKDKDIATTRAAPEPETTAPGTCIFDDQMFGLTAESKVELAAQLKTGSLKEALEWTRSGGWWSCAAEGQLCTCAGEVRFMGLDRIPLSRHPVDATEFGNEVRCEGKTFSVERPNVLKRAELSPSCECHTKGGPENGIVHHLDSSANGTMSFHLTKRLTSQSLLQESWIFLLRLLGRSRLLPAGTGDRTYSGMENWASRSGPVTNKFPWIVPERYWIVKFMRETVAQNVLAGSSCMEWGNPNTPGQGLTYSDFVPGCQDRYDLQTEYTNMRRVGNVIYSDILHLPQVLGDLRLDVIFASQIFEHVADPMNSAKALFDSLKPGGLVVFTAPQQAQFHKVPHDFYRYTVEGAKFVFVQAGFCVPNSGFAGGGDFIFDIARNAGLQVQDFPIEELEGAYQSGFQRVSHSAVGIKALAFKAPHVACQDSTSGWEDLQREGIRASA